MLLSSLTRRRRHPRRLCNERGYILLTLTLVMALMVIFAAAIVPTIAFEIRRDREEEMIHRGVQYSRAIRAYYKKFGRYPTKIEDLESANNMRFLRKRYKDPMNCKNGKCEDFKLLHFGEVKLSLSLGMGGGTIPGANSVGANSLNSPGALNSTGFGSSPTSQLGQSSPTANTPAGTDPTQPGSQPSPDAAGTNPGGTTPDSTSGNSGDKLAGVTFGGGPIIGVASANKKDVTIREFNHKKKYNEWQFVYDPAMDRGALITTPYQPQLQGFGQQGIPNLNSQQPGNNSPFSSGPGGLQNNPTTPSTPGFGAPSPPSNPPQQQ